MTEKIPINIRLKVYRRAKFLCERCGCYSPELTIHHRIPKFAKNNPQIIVEGFNDLQNLIVLCPHCQKEEHKDDNKHIFELSDIENILKVVKNSKLEIDFLVKQELIKKIVFYKNIIKKDGDNEKQA